MEIEFGVVFKMARGRGTRDGEELELSVKSNKACKSKMACFYVLLNENCEGAWNSSRRGTRIEH